MGFKDKLFYKQRPYIYAALAIVALFFARKSKLALVCGVILLVCSYAVFEMRKKYQEKQALMKLKEAEMTKKTGIVEKIIIDE